MRWLVVADDLTGACDAAVHFAVRGYRTVVALDDDLVDAPVVAVSTESRDEEEAVIRRRIAAVAERYPGRTVFKKIDSTLRGNTACEVDAAMSAFGFGEAVVTPASPAMGRMVERGRLHLPGDPGFAPVDVAAHLGLGERVRVADAICDADLDLLAGTVGGHLWAGSGGLASALVRALPVGPGFSVAAARRGSVVFAIGSTHPATVAQVERLRMECPEARVVAVPRGVATLAETRRALAGASEAAVFVCGGDTASHVLAALGARSIELVDEVVAGVPRGVVRSGEFDGRWVVTKSGGFGGPETMVRVVECLGS